MRAKKILSSVILSALSSLIFLDQVSAQDKYPSKTVTIVSPFSAGGGTDYLARLLASELTKSLGQSVIVENRPGANGMIGSNYVAKANPDGYTLVLGTVGSHGINQAVYDNVPYDTIKDFSPISLIARTPMLVLANMSVKANNARELVAEATQAKAPMIYSSAGVGSVGHIAGELFSQEAGVNLIHAPYKGAAPAAIDLAGGQVPLMFGTPISTDQHVKAGKVKILGVTSADRSTLVPDVPTLSEQGFKNFDVSTWYGLFAPANTPPAIVQLIAQKTKAILAEPKIQEQLLKQGLETVGNSPDEFKQILQSEVTKWGKVKISK